MNRRTLLSAPLILVPTKGWAAESLQLMLGQTPVTFEIEGEVEDSAAALMALWVRKSAGAVIGYYGRFPVPQAYLHIIAEGPQGVRGGQTFPGEVPLIRVRAGAASTAEQLLVSDWVMVHEMVHLAFPWMNRRHDWMAEGLAVYIESVARVQAGHLLPERMWHSFVTMMPRGLPLPGEGGLDVTVTWGRTYWGGATFCLLADVAIRKATGNSRGLQHALRAINAERDFRREWDFGETLAIGDAATGTNVLASQYAAMRIEPVSPDLAGLWSALGVMPGSASVVLDDRAPLAAIRLAIEQRS